MTSEAASAQTTFLRDATDVAHSAHTHALQRNIESKDVPELPELPDITPPVYYAPAEGTLVFRPDVLTPADRVQALHETTGAFIRTEKGAKEFVVPHTLDNTRALWGLGHKEVDAPISQYYDWPMEPGKKPFRAQRKAAGFLTVHDRAFNLSQLGTGKTLSALHAYDYLRKIGRARKALVLAPLSTTDLAWADDCRKHLPHLNMQVLTGPRDRRSRRYQEDADVYVMNHDGIKTGDYEDLFKKRTDVDTVIIDEVTMVGRNHTAQRWKAINRLINTRGREKRVWALTGSPTPNAPTDAWAQAKLVVPATTERYFGRFRNLVQYQVDRNGWKWADKPGAKEIVLNTLQPSIRFERKDCMDLPPTTRSRRAVRMSPQQTKAYREMKAMLRAQHAAGTITASNAGIALGKLLQICCGMVYGDDDLQAQFPCPDRVQEVCDIVDAAEGKAIVYVPYRNSLAWLTKELRAKGYTVEQMDGSTSAGRRKDIVDRFQNETDPQVLVGQPHCMSHGLTLTASSVIVWFSAIMDNDVFIQANGRIDRPGQTMENHVIMLEGSPIETRMYDTLEKRGSAQDALLDEIRDNTM